MFIRCYITGPLQVNTYLVMDEETGEGMIVDPGAYSSQLENDIVSECKNIKYIFLTHGHADHIGGVEDFQNKFPKAKILAGKNEKEILENPALNSSLDFSPKPISIKLDDKNYLQEGDEIKLGELVFNVIETPGHTPGGLSLYTKDAVFCGDTLFRMSVGRTDFYGGDYNALASSIKEKLFKLPDNALVLPGHMDQTSIGYEKKYNPFFGIGRE